MCKWSRILPVCGLLVGLLGAASPAEAAEFTDILDAADDKDDYSEATYDPFDFNLEPRFTYETGKAQITREAPCVASTEGDYDTEFQNDIAETNPRVQFDPGRCQDAGIQSGDAGVVENKEMIYRHQEARLDIQARVGIYKDLELHINAPVVFSESNDLKYANESGQEVSGENSWVDPNDGRIESNAQDTFSGTSNQGEALGRLNQFKTHRYFALTDEFSGYERSGFDDPSIGIAWAPYNDQRDDTKATLMLGMDYVVPIAKIRSAENKDAVGDGMHKLKWKFGSSKQFDWIDPYFGMQYMLQIPARGSPIKELKEVDANNEGQSVTQPPQEGKISIGTEFVPKEVEKPDVHKRYAIDLNFTFGYTSEGRDYTPLYDHMVNSRCNGMTRNEILPNYSGGSYQGPGNVECSWIAQRPANVRPDPTYDLTNLESGDEFRTNGIMTVESYATFAGHLGFYIQPTRYFQFKVQGGITHQQEHFLTNARTGSDVEDSREATSDNKVDLTGQDSAIERNPAYNSTYDSPGTRFRVSEYNIFNVMVTAALQF